MSRRAESPPAAAPARAPDAALSERLRELEVHAANLEKTRDHHESHIANLEQHAANLTELRGRLETRVRDLEAHAANLEQERSTASERIHALEAHAANLERELAARGRRLDELARHASNLEQLAQSGRDRLIPGYRSRFGGLWIDRSDAAEQIEAKLAAGAISAREAEQLAAFRRDGIAVLEGAVSARTAERLTRAVERSYASGRKDLFVECFENGEKQIRAVAASDRERDLKLLDVHAQIPEAQPVVFAPEIARMLTLLFEQPPLAFQSLFFRYGTEQPMHQDTAYVAVSAPLEFVGCWVALEDIREGTGELEYYVGSHALDDFLWDGRYKAMPPNHADHGRYLAWLHEASLARGLERRRFLPKCGDALIWSADIAHGGSQRTRRDLTRLSLVTHYCPANAEPRYFEDRGAHSGRVPVFGAGFVSFPYRGAKSPARGPAARRWPSLGGLLR